MSETIAKPEGLTSVPNDAWVRLHPIAQASIAAGHAAGRLNSHLIPVAEARARFDTEMRDLPRPEVGAVIDEQLEWDGQQVGARRYEPMAADAMDTVIVYFHGGGWVIGSLDSADIACRELCLATGATVISVDYRLAPEAKFPAAINDAVLAVRGVAARYPNRRLVVAGDSAGGNLATVAAIELRDEVLVDHQLLIYPVTTCDLHIGFDMTFEGISLYFDEMQLNTELYIEDASQMSDPRVAPLGADVHGLPPVTMVLAECDPITAQGRLYADALRAAGVEVHERTFDHLFHGFFGLDGLIPEAREAMNWIARSLQP